MVDHATDAATEVFIAHRNLLFIAADEMLGSAADGRRPVVDAYGC